MLFKIAAVAVATALGSFAAQADISGPASLPPAGFKGQQFVDSRGCIFLKAGYGGQVTWVARVTRDRKPLCGYPPTFGGKGAVAVAQASPAPEAAPAPARQTQTVAAIPESSYVPPPARTGKPVPTMMPALPSPSSSLPRQWSLPNRSRN